jgi:hypothetical protein
MDSTQPPAAATQARPGTSVRVRLANGRMPLPGHGPLPPLVLDHGPHEMAAAAAARPTRTAATAPAARLGGGRTWSDRDNIILLITKSLGMKYSDIVEVGLVFG